MKQNNNNNNNNNNNIKENKMDGGIEEVQKQGRDSFLFAITRNQSLSVSCINIFLHICIYNYFFLYLFRSYIKINSILYLI